MTRLTVLSVAFPLAPVAPDTAGGAEQVLAQIDRALVLAGHHSLVIAASGSSVAGMLIETQAVAPPFDDRARTAARERHSAAVERACHRFPVDVVHMHGLDFDAYLPPPGVPTLATLHLPLGWYPASALRPERPRTYLHCVSSVQERGAPKDVSLLPPIENGVDVELFESSLRKRRFCLFLGRVCPEKGVHLAIEAAALAGMPLLIAGEVFPYEEHTRYFAIAIVPRLNRMCRFIGRVGLRQKRRLLMAARCVLIPSLVEETSSLVAREALAAGTPVIGFARGALAEIVRDGRTGFLVDSVEAMAARIRQVETIDTGLCREDARRRYPLHAMTDSYLRLYRRLAQTPMRAVG